MPKDYSSVCSKIITYYDKYISENEKEALSKIIKLNDYNFNITIFINKIIDRIWNMFLTKPENYKDGQSFNFLVTRDIPITPENLDCIKELTKKGNHTLELITDKNVSNTFVGINGVIVEIDYLNSFSEPLLPCDFLKKRTTDTKLNIKGLYNISLNLDKYDYDEERCLSVSEIFYFKLISINKPLYNKLNNNTLLDKEDLKALANYIITYYLVDKKIIDVKLRDKLEQTYLKLIKEKYLSFFYNEITLDEFITIIFNSLDEEKTIMVDKKM